MHSNLNCLELGYVGMEFEGVLIISKIIRLNRVIRNLNISGAAPGNAISEIGRAMIVNTSIRSLTLNECQLTNIRELAQCLGVSRTLLQLSLAGNNIDQQSIDLIEENLGRNKFLVHLGLSGNSRISMAVIERLKRNCPANVEVDIAKEEDFFTSKEAKKVALFHYAN
jgi:hypothetical protein